MVRLINAKKVSFETVLNRYYLDHALKDEAWEIYNLKRANKKFGSWVQAIIAVEDIGGIVLPYHVGACDQYSDLPQKILLVPPSGLTLDRAYIRFKRIRRRYRRLAPVCYERIMRAKQLVSQDPGLFFFSQEPILIGSTYQGLTRFRGQLTHLDGLHRLMALMEVDEKPGYISCYVAVSAQKMEGKSYNGSPRQCD
jgi:hypothetical protein